MIVVSGQAYVTIIDAAEELGVSAKTIRQYIARGIIAEPPIVHFGIRTVKHFPEKYMREAKKKLADYRAAKSINK